MPADPTPDFSPEAIAEALREATAGPWDWQAGLMAEGSERTYAGYPQRIMARNPDPTDTSPVLIAETFDGHEDQRPPHAHLIANSPTWLAQLLAALEAAEKERDEARRALKSIRDGGHDASAARKAAAALDRPFDPWCPYCGADAAVSGCVEGDCRG